MLSISKPIQGAGQGEYYLSLAAVDDYYLEGDREAPGFWLGLGAEKLGLRGRLKPEEFRNLLRGFSPDGARPLVRNTGGRRRAGWDLTWSAPKSVSVAWSQAPPEIRFQFEAAMRAATAVGVGYLETVGVVSRTGENGVLKTPASLLFAAFPHTTSRAQDPQLHVHTILLNVGVRADGSTGTLEPKVLYRHQLAAGAVFRAELAHQIETRLGLRAIREGRAFELIGVSRELMTEFSKRRVQIEALLRERGWEGPKASEAAALSTRDTKESVARNDLFERWQTLGRQFNWGQKELLSLLFQPQLARDVDQLRTATGVTALWELTQGRNYFESRHLVQAMAEVAQGCGMGGSSAVTLAKELLNNPELVRLKDRAGEHQWTTKEVLRLERSLLEKAQRLWDRQTPFPAVGPLLAEALQRNPLLNEEQQTALNSVCAGWGGLTLVQGMAGTGKSTLFRSAYDIWQAQGLTVVGAALAGKAARGLEESTGIPSQTLHRLLHALERKTVRLEAQTVVLIDEAGMVGTRQLHHLMECCETAGAGIVLCGDSKQLQAIERGGSFGALCRRFGASELTQIVRQKETWAREMVKDLSNGRATQALGESLRRGLVSESEDSSEASKELITAWGSVQAPAEQRGAILSARVEAVAELNRLAQAQQKGVLSGPSVCFGNEQVFGGDRVLFVRNSAPLDVMNGDLGTVTAVKDDTLEVRLDAGREVRVNPAEYKDIRLGYALTAHKAQGATFEHAYVLTTPNQDREISYVEASRASGETRWFLPHSFASAVHGMAKSNEKLLASELLPEGVVLELCLRR